MDVFKGTRRHATDCLLVSLTIELVRSVGCLISKPVAQGVFLSPLVERMFFTVSHLASLGSEPSHATGS